MTNLTVFQSKSEQSKAVATNQTATLPTLQVSATNATVDMTVGNGNSMLDKAKAFFMKPIQAGSKILYWHVALGAVVAFVLYVEMFADRKTQRKLKFW